MTNILYSLPKCLRSLPTQLCISEAENLRYRMHYRAGIRAPGVVPTTVPSGAGPIQQPERIVAMSGANIRVSLE